MPQSLKEKPTGPSAICVRPPVLDDAPAMHAMAARCGLDLNSEYSYLMVCQYFRATSAVAVHGGRVVGFVSGFLVPDSPSELFVWQVAVAPEMRGRGVAGTMLDSLTERLGPSGLNYVQATINPSNEASKRTFGSLAGRLRCEISHRVVFSAGHFSGEGHEEEVLYRIGPFRAPGNGGGESSGADENNDDERQQG